MRREERRDEYRWEGKREEMSTEEKGREKRWVQMRREERRDEYRWEGNREEMRKEERRDEDWS